MSEYRNIQKIIEGATVEYATLKLVPRGTPIFPDVLMTGQMRFGRRLGANFSVMNPDNILRLTSAVAAKTQSLPVERVIAWLEQDALLTFNGIEMFEVIDWSVENKTVMIRQPLTAAKTVSDIPKLWATPMVMHADAAAGASVISVRSRYNLLNGDTVTFPVNQFLSSLTERNVILASSGGTSLLDPDFPFIYNLTLDRPIPIALLENNSPVYLRAFPAYYSPVIRVPKLQAPSQMGPFVLDYVSSPLDSVPQYQETFSYRTFDGGGSPVHGTGTELVTINKNHPVVSRPMWAEGMLFWKVKRGSGGFIFPNRYRMISDDTGKVRVSTDLLPKFPSGFSWSMKIRASSDGVFRIAQYPLGVTEYPLIANSVQTITFTTSPGQQIERLDFMAHLEVPGSEVVLQDANTTGAVSASFQYGLVFRVVGDSNFQSTSVIVKPYFLSLSDLAARYDSGQTYDSGLIYL